MEAGLENLSEERGQVQEEERRTGKNLGRNREGFRNGYLFHNQMSPKNLVKEVGPTDGVG